MKANPKTQPQQVLTRDLRETLKNIMRNEVEKIPEFLETLKPKERLNFTAKMMPYIFPKVEAVSPSIGEPLQFDWPQ